MKEKFHLQYIGLDEMIILKFILGKYDGELWARFMWLRNRDQ
jgi:hypothetical protein